MKILLKELAPVVAFVSSFSRDDSVAPSSFLWFAKGNVCAFSGTSGAIWTAPKGMDDFTVQASGFASIVKSLAAQFDDLDLKVSETRVSIKAGAFRAQLPCWPRDVEAPREWFAREAPKGGVTVDDDFWAAVARVKPSASHDDGKPAMRGVFWAADGTLVASDNSQITLCYPKPDSKMLPPGGKGVLIPLHLLAQLGAAPGLTRAIAEDTALWFAAKAGAVYGQQFATEFPASITGLVKTLGKPEARTRVELKGNALSVIDRLLFFAKKAAIKVDCTKKTTVRMWVAETDGDGKSAEEVVEAKVEGDGGEFTVDGKMLRNAVVVAPSFTYAAGKPLYFHNPETRIEHVVCLLAS